MPRLPYTTLLDLATEPGAITIIKEKLKEIHKEIDRLEFIPKEKELVSLFIAPLRKRYRKLRALLPSQRSLTSPTISPETIERAKQVPLLDIALNVTRGGIGPYTTSGRAKALCPFHKERTPSFTIYLDSNSYYCFGCNKSGDSIDYVRQLHHYSFREAITYLTGLV